MSATEALFFKCDEVRSLLNLISRIPHYLYFDKIDEQCRTCPVIMFFLLFEWTYESINIYTVKVKSKNIITIQFCIIYFFNVLLL